MDAMGKRGQFLPLVLALLCTALAGNLQGATGIQANSHPLYQQLRNIGLSGEAVSVENLTIKRDTGTFLLRSGTVCFLSPVEGRVTGAVFTGEGTFSLVPTPAAERRSLTLLSREPHFEERYGELVLRFTDGTYEEIKRAGRPASGTCPAGLLHDNQNDLRHQLKYNLSARILQDVLSSQPGGLFFAFLKGKKYNSRMMYAIDPHGAPEVAPEEVELMTWDPNKQGIWAAFHLESEYASGKATSDQANALIDVEQQQLDTTIERNGNLTGKATTQFAAQSDGVRVVGLQLYRTLRVESVTDSRGEALFFIQEDKNDDAQFLIVLPHALKANEKYTVVTTYAGKEVVHNEGGGNYYPVARESWYPNGGFGDYATYDMTFRIPKGMTMAATGTLVEERTEGNQSVTHWRSEVPLTVAGFNFGRFKREEAKLAKEDYLVQAFANTDTPDILKPLTSSAADFAPPSEMYVADERYALGTMQTTPLLKKALAEAQLSVQLFSEYFGPAPYKRLAVTQQTAFNYGQSWPGLVYLPISYFFDTTTRHGLRMDDPHGYFRVVEPHEVAHQWWGHMVGFRCYRDQWMSEGFAEMSASLFLQLVEKNPQKFIEFWNDERRLLLETSAEGFRPIDVGPVTMGYRLMSSRAGFDIPRRLLYPKGAYILHMIRMMLWDPRNGDKRFKELMHDFAATYANRPASTEDFKSMVEKHMTAEMNLAGDGRMGWFFDEYVYGTALPAYTLEYSFSNDTAGDVVVKLRVTQSNVDNQFRMLVPIYLELNDGRIVFAGRARMIGNVTAEHETPLRGLKERPKRVLLSYYRDVLEAGK